MSDPLEFTGERFVPGARGEIWYEHWHRYHFAAPLVAGRDTLDIACGAGYGSALLARHAAKVVGADLSQEAIDHARTTYASVANLAFTRADCSSLPFPDASFDAVVSFETIEHVSAQEKFLTEVRRVLRPEGLFVLSSPNKFEYTDRRGFSNEFHLRELYREELAALLAPHFPHSTWFGQRISFFSVVWPEHGEAQGELFEVSEASASQIFRGHARPLYFIVVASSAAETIASVVPRLSVLADRDEWMHHDYAKAWADLEIQWNRGNTLDGVVAEWQGHFQEAVRQRDALQVAAVSHAAQRAQLELKIDAQQHEIERRASVRWWLALPWLRIRNGLKRAGMRS